MNFLSSGVFAPFTKTFDVALFGAIPTSKTSFQGGALLFGLRASCDIAHLRPSAVNGLYLSVGPFVNLNIASGVNNMTSGGLTGNLGASIKVMFPVATVKQTRVALHFNLGLGLVGFSGLNVTNTSFTVFSNFYTFLSPKSLINHVVLAASANLLNRFSIMFGLQYAFFGFLKTSGSKMTESLKSARPDLYGTVGILFQQDDKSFVANSKQSSSDSFVSIFDITPLLGLVDVSFSLLHDQKPATASVETQTAGDLLKKY